MTKDENMLIESKSCTFALLAQDATGLLRHGWFRAKEGSRCMLVSCKAHESEGVLAENVPSIL